MRVAHGTVRSARGMVRVARGITGTGIILVGKIQNSRIIYGITNKCYSLYGFVFCLINELSFGELGIASQTRG